MKSKTTRRALLSSCVALMLCFSMLLGTTYAWFTDEVTSNNNIIKSGTLKATLKYKDENGILQDASTGSIFNYQYWEPGYVDVKTIEIGNAGNLAFKYQLNIIPNVLPVAGEYNLADVIDVYIGIGDTRATLEDATYVGTLSSLMADPDGAAYGYLLPAEGVGSTNIEASIKNHGLTEIGTVEVAIALKMQENAGNEYQELSVGEGFSVQLLATQLTYENDSFGPDYDEDAEYPVVLTPVAPEVIKSAFTSADGTELKGKIENVVFGKISDYPEIVSGNTAISNENGIAVYRVANGDLYDVYYLSENKIALPADSTSLFADMSELTKLDTSNLDMSQVETALCMFLNCSKLETLDTSDWDVSNMTNMQSIFYGCNKLKNIDVSNWDTSNVTNMRMVFFRCYELSNDVLKGVENWDVSNVSNFYSMFKHARGLTSLDLSNWDTSSATNMSHLFANCGGIETLDLSGFDTSNVKDMSWMFYDASKMTTVYVGDGWTTEALEPANATCFYNNQALVGGAGTTWLDVCDMANPNRPWESSAKLDYAIVDGGTGNPGLLTHK